MYNGRRILVVEDEPLIAMLIADWLVELECDLAGAVNAAPAALKIAGQTKLDAALLDVNLGTDNSFALADTLSAGGVPLAFITGRDSHSLPERFRSAPVLRKPFDFESIKALLHQLLASAGGS